MTDNPFRQLPSVQSLLDHFPAYKHERLVDVCRYVLHEARQAIAQGSPTPDLPTLLATIQHQLTQAEHLSLRGVINASGVIIHTNLGRAPLATAALEAIQLIANGYSTLEFDIATGTRGQRNNHVEELLCAVTGAEAAVVVNNNAAALYLVLNALTQGREVVISRGELVEIGGGFRIPDVMRQSGADLVEVGTTNRTRLADFANALTSQTAAFLRVHSSNFKLVGFTESAALTELAALAHQHEVLLIDDVGSGALLDTTQFGLGAEPMVQASLAAGADVVLFSGDKLLGGPQAGIIVGKTDPINRLRHHPLMRALRPDKLTLAALAATLSLYRDTNPTETIPVWQMISADIASLHQRATTWQTVLGGEVVAADSTIGGGSLPDETLPTYALALTVPRLDNFALALRQATPPIIGRIQHEQLRLDPRSVLLEQDAIMMQTMRTILDKI